MKTWLVTGGAGFIGSCFIRNLLREGNVRVVNLDLLTYAGHLENIPSPPVERYEFVKGDIGDACLVSELLESFRPSAIINFAAESHVDRSIDGPAAFLQTNVLGTFNLLQESSSYYHTLSNEDRETFRFLHVSTDEVFGSLGTEGYFVETSPYQPNSPYSASKASAEMFVRAFHETYKLPVLITNGSNTYGPYQFPEKLIPLMILHAITGKRLPIYGDGGNIRDWLHVEDHCQAIRAVLSRGKVGQKYCIGGDSERTNLQVVHAICDAVEELTSKSNCRNLIEFVADRPGHDRRYAIDASRMKSELDWIPTLNFASGLRETVAWYLSHGDWVTTVTKNSETLPTS